MKFDKSLLRTVLFSLAVFFFVIGTYQTILSNSKNGVIDNYWLFMISFICLMMFRFLKPAEEKQQNLSKSKSATYKKGAKPAKKPVSRKPRG